MTLDEAIKRYSENAEYERTHGNLQGCLDFRQLAEWLRELNQLREQTSWIPVSERLPEEEGNYLVCYNNGYISVSEWHPNPYEKVCFDIFPSLIVAWMPLPKSYVTDINVGKIVESEGKK